MRTGCWLLVATSDGDRHSTLRGWGLVAAGLSLVIGGAIFLPIVRARNPDGTSKYVPQGSEGFKVVMSLLLAIAGLAMVVAGVIQAM